MSFAYDIRGIYPSEVNETVAYRAGRAIPLFLKGKKFILGRDCRTSSLALKKSLTYGLVDQGCTIIDIGFCSTPMTYFASMKENALMVTASHNPKEYNGIKITKKGVVPVGSNNGLKKIEELMNACHFQEPRNAKKANVKQGELLPDYVKFLRKLVPGSFKNLKVLVDCGNGMAGFVVPSLFKKTGIMFDLLYGDMDGNFPNHTPNPAIPKNTKELQRLVKKKKYDLGIAYDGDCDRVFFIDEKGNRIRCEFILALFAQELKKNESVVYTVNSSRIVKDVAKEKGIKSFKSAIGHTEIPEVMKKTKSKYGAEITGHFYFKDFKYADSGDIAAMKVLSILSKSKKRISELIKPFQRYEATEEINFKVKDTASALQRIEKEYSNCSIDRTDGISINAKDYWFNVRVSKTEGFVRLNAEAKSKSVLKSSVEKLSKIISGK